MGLHRYIIAAALCITPGFLCAQTVRTGNFEVRIAISAECQIISTPALDFGMHGVLTSAVDAAATLQVACTNTTPYTIGLSSGLGAGATTSLRRMTAGADTIDYSLFRDSARTATWGNTIGVDTAAATGTGAAQSFTVYGRVPAQTTPSSASYTDTVTVTVTY